MTLSDDIKIFNEKIDVWDRDVFDKTGELIYTSIVEGSAITGAPGQPVDEGGLRASWSRVYEDANTQLIGSGLSSYNLQNEDGIARPGGGEYKLKSPVGGRHSVALTVAGFGAIVDAAKAGDA